MERDYTSYMYNTLLAQIDEINDEEWCGFTDLLGDLGLSLGSGLGIIDSERYVDDISSYHKLVLDQHDANAEKIDEIFSNVHDTDLEYGGISGGTYSAFLLFDESIKDLNKAVNPNKLCFDTKVLGMIKEEYLNRVTRINENINNAYERALDKKEAMIAEQAVMGLVEGLISVCIGVGGVVVGVATGNPVLAATSGWDVINGTIGCVQDAVAAGTIVAGKIAGECGNQELRQKLLAEAQDYAGRDGLAGEFEAAGWEEFAIATDALDVILDVVSIADGIGSKAIGKADKLDDIYKNIKSVSDMYDAYKTAKNINTGYEIIKGAYEGNLGEVIVEEVIVDKIDINENGLETVDYVDSIIKVKKAADKTNEYIESWLE